MFDAARQLSVTLVWKDAEGWCYVGLGQVAAGTRVSVWEHTKPVSTSVFCQWWGAYWSISVTPECLSFATGDTSVFPWNCGHRLWTTKVSSADHCYLLELGS